MSDESLIDEAISALRSVTDYQVDAGVLVKPGETFPYGTATLKFSTGGSNSLEVWEYIIGTDSFRPGADSALALAKAQRDVCLAQGASFSPPHLDQLASISAGVIEGVATEGMRYAMPAHHSGWVLLREGFSGSVNDLTAEHLAHVLEARGDLARLLALPPGYRFFVSPAELIVEYDPALAAARMEID